MAAVKIIVIGSIENDLAGAFAKINTLHAKNKFTLALVAGNLFPTDAEAATAAVVALLSGSVAISLPTYFTLGSAPLPAAIVERLSSGQDICENLHFLGRRGVTKTLEGVRIAALGGKPRADTLQGDKDGGKEETDGATGGGDSGNGGNGGNGGSGSGSGSGSEYALTHGPEDYKTLASTQGVIDVLLTTTWPSGVWSGSKVRLGAPIRAIPNSDDMAVLCAGLRPRYHFAPAPGGFFFFEREPFAHAPSGDGMDGDGITRFIGLGSYGNESKAKALYAFSLPSPDVHHSVPAGTTASPFSRKRGRDKEAMVPEDNGFRRFAVDDGGDGGSRSRQMNKRRRRSPPPGPDRCFFCLSNPNLSSHMCVSIGEESYLATAKGPLTTTAAYAEYKVDFPSHFLIIPLAHQPTISSIGSPSDEGGDGDGDGDGDARRAHKEMDRFREAVQAMVSARSGHQLGAVTWEINRSRNVHAHWQCLAVPADKIRKGLVEAAFKVEAENLGYQALATRDLSLVEQASLGDYFRLWVWADDGEDKIKGKCLVMPLDPAVRFDLQFGRRVMAKLLGLESRQAWQDCVQTQTEEEKDAAVFREAFRQWDFTLEQS